MKAEFRNTLWVALAVAALSMIACGPPASTTDGGTGGGSATDSKTLLPLRQESLWMDNRTV